MVMVLTRRREVWRSWGRAAHHVEARRRVAQEAGGPVLGAHPGGAAVEHGVLGTPVHARRALAPHHLVLHGLQRDAQLLDQLVRVLARPRVHDLAQDGLHTRHHLKQNTAKFYM